MCMVPGTSDREVWHHCAGGAWFSGEATSSISGAQESVGSGKGEQQKQLLRVSAVLAE